MKNIFFLVVALHFIAASVAQNSELKVTFNSTDPNNQHDAMAIEIFKKLILKEHNKHPEFPFDKISVFINQFNPNFLDSNCLASISAYDYLDFDKNARNKIIPILIVKKDSANSPYYPAFFIVNKNSKIKNFKSPHIKRLYLGNTRSCSGYIMPLFELYNSGIIEAPTEAAVRKKGWDCILTGSHIATLSKMANDTNAIGATGQIPKSNIDVFVKILEYGRLPQNIVVISKNIEPYREIFLNIFVEIFKNKNSASFFGNSSFRITGFEVFNMEHQNAFDALNEKIKIVKSAQLDTWSNFNIKTIAAIGILIFMILLIIIWRSKYFEFKNKGYRSRKPTLSKDSMLNIAAVRHKIQSSYLEDAINQLYFILKGKSNRYYDEIIIQHARLNQLEKDVRIGKINRDQEIQERNSIVASITALLDEIESDESVKL